MHRSSSAVSVPYLKNQVIKISPSWLSIEAEGLYLICGCTT